MVKNLTNLITKINEPGLKILYRINIIKIIY